MKTEIKKLPLSIRKNIRTEKSKIRLQFLDYKKREELVSELYKKAWATQDRHEAKMKAKKEKKAAPKAEVVAEPKAEKPKIKAKAK